MPTFDLFVKSHDSPPNKELLLFIRQNIEKIKALRVRINIHPISADDQKDPKILEKLREEEIENLPSMKTANGIYEGTPEIIKLFNKNFQRAEPKPKPPQDPYDVRSFQSKILSMENDDETEDISRTFQKRSREMEKKRNALAKSYKGNKNVKFEGSDDMEDDDPQPRRPSKSTSKKSGGSRAGSNRRAANPISYSDDEHNIQSDPDSAYEETEIEKSINAIHQDGDLDSELMLNHMENNIGF